MTHDQMAGFTMKKIAGRPEGDEDLFWGLSSHDPWMFHGQGIVVSAGKSKFWKDDHQSIVRFRVVHCGWISMIHGMDADTVFPMNFP